MGVPSLVIMISGDDGGSGGCFRVEDLLFDFAFDRATVGRAVSTKGRVMGVAAWKGWEGAAAEAGGNIEAGRKGCTAGCTSGCLLRLD